MDNRIVPFISAGILLTFLPLYAEDTKTVGDGKLVSAVNSRIAKIEPSRQDRKIDEIGWVPTIREALKLAKQTNRPIFFFTHDGDISTGRC
jgi:hypothetical protein